MKNHYIPRFIIKRFSTLANVFNLNTGEIREKRPTNKIFFEKNKYSDNTEIILNQKLETPFSKLLINKLLEKDQICINRKQLFLIKKYMLVSSIRTMTPGDYRKFLTNLIPNAKHFYMLRFDLICFLPSVKDWVIDDQTLFDNALIACASSRNIMDLLNNPLLTREMAALAIAFLNSYVTFWDADEQDEFVLTDGGTISEYEGVQQITGGLDLSKRSYLFHQVKKRTILDTFYGSLMASNEMMFENYGLFNISSKRCIVAVNPFYRLYNETEVKIEEKIYKPEIPDIWPAVIQNKTLFKTPENKYVAKGKRFDLNDKFTYTPKVLSHKETIYINSLLISQAKSWVGFNDPKKVIESFAYCLERKSCYSSIKSPDVTELEIGINYVSTFFSDPLGKIIKWCSKEESLVDWEENCKLFDELTSEIYLDFDTNFYIYEYLLDRKQETYDNKNLDFLGKGNKDEKMKYIQDHYDKLTSEKKKQTN